MLLQLFPDICVVRTGSARRYSLDRIQPNGGKALFGRQIEAQIASACARADKDFQRNAFGVQKAVRLRAFDVQKDGPVCMHCLQEGKQHFVLQRMDEEIMLDPEQVVSERGRVHNGVPDHAMG